MRRNRLREKLDAGEPTLGTHLLSCWPTLVELVGQAGHYDYVEFTAEYAPFDLHDLDNLGRALELAGLGGMMKHEQTQWTHQAMRSIGSGFQSALFADVRTVEDAIARGIAQPAPGEVSRNRLQIPTLLAAIEEFRFDCCIGGARRDEEKARAKERFFSHRDGFGQWDPKNQRPEIWNLYNARLNPGENMRVFPLSNWTELDVWEYIRRERLEVPSIYFSHSRRCVRRGGQWLPVTDLAPVRAREEVRDLVVRVRTIGDIISTGCVESRAAAVDDIIAEIAAARVTERGSRADDRASEAAMEDRKKAGYF